MYKFEDYILNQIGQPIQNASVTIFLAGTTTPATIFSDDGITTTANPVTTNTLGRFSFFIADGRYDLKVTGSGLTTYTRANIEILDATERSSTDIAWAVDSMTTGKWNNVRVVDGGKFATIAAAITDLSAAGGKVIIPSGATFDAATVSITKPVWLEFLGPAYTFSGTGSAFSIAVEGVRISGAGRPGSGTTQGTVINVSNTATIGINATNAPGLSLDNFALVGPGSGTGKGIVISGTRPKIDNVLVASFGSDGITLDGTTINTNLGTVVHVRSQNNGGHGFKTLGTNANVTQFNGADAGGNGGDGFNIATGGNVFNGTNTSANNPNGYHFLSGAVKNTGTLFSDAPNGTETKALVFDAGANNNYFTPMMSLPVSLVTDNGSGNRYLHSTTDSAFNGVTISSGSAGGGTTLGSLAAAATVYTANFPGAAAGAHTIPLLDQAQTWSASQTFSPGTFNGGNPPQSGMVTATFTNATTVASNITGLSFSVAASTNYTMSCHLYYQGSAGTAGLDITITGPAAPTSVFYSYDEDATSTSLQNSVASAFGTKLIGNAAITATTNLHATVTMGLRNGTTAGTIQVQGSATGAGTVTVQPGSFCQLQ